MHAKIHRDFAFKVVELYPNKDLLKFLLESMVRPDWRAEKRTEANRIEWLKQWMDSPDDTGHMSAVRNDHSYKIRRKGKRYELVFGKSKQEQATVVARLKYDARDIYEWKVEDEPRICALELAICMHWVVDMTSPPHAYSDCDDDLHYKIEKDFDSYWQTAWPQIEKKIVFGKKLKPSKVYLWGKHFIESHYDQNEALINAYKAKKTMIKDSACAALATAVLQDIAQNIADFLSYADNRIHYSTTYKKLLDQNSNTIG